MELGPRWLRPPAQPPAYVGPAPVRDGDAGTYVAHHESRAVRVGPARYVTWSESAPLADVLPGDPRVPAVVRTEIVAGEWNQPGARRRVVLSDGHFAAEEVLTCGWDEGTHVFEYVVFGYTSYAGLVIDHAVGRFRVSPDRAGARVDWDYSFRPRAAILRPALRVFVRRVWAPYMADVLTRMQQTADRDA